MSSAAHREQLEELRRRVSETAGLGRPVPHVSVDVARLLVDLIAELGACVLELELAEELRR